MEIIEQALVPKSATTKSEDGIVVTADFVAVIDGSTSKSSYRYSLRHPLRALRAGAWQASNGRYAMRVVASHIRRMAGNASCEQFLRGATAALRRQYPKSLLARLAEHPEERLTCSAVVFSRLRRELWMVGDCQALITPADGGATAEGTLLENPKPSEAVLAAQRAAEMRRLLSEGHTTEELRAHDLARPTILPRMIETMRQQNIGYSVVDGFPIPRQHVRVIPLDFRPWHVVLASDGYPFLRPTLQESEALLERQRRDDPLNIGPHFQATKGFPPGANSFDDRTYVRLLV